MADDRVSIWNQYLKIFREPASGELMLGNGTDFTLSSLSAVIDAAFPSAVQGSILYRGATDWTVLNPGTAGQLLQTGGTAANPSWATGYSPPAIANNTIVSNVSGSSAAPAANTLTQVLDSVAGNTQGSILYRSATAWTVLPPGTNGQVLKTAGTGGDPFWGSTTGTYTLLTTVTPSAATTDILFTASARIVIYYLALNVNGTAINSAVTAKFTATSGAIWYPWTIQIYLGYGTNYATGNISIVTDASGTVATTVTANGYNYDGTRPQYSTVFSGTGFAAGTYLNGMQITTSSGSTFGGGTFYVYSVT